MAERDFKAVELEAFSVGTGWGTRRRSHPGGQDTDVPLSTD